MNVLFLLVVGVHAWLRESLDVCAVPVLPRSSPIRQAHGL